MGNEDAKNDFKKERDGPKRRSTNKKALEGFKHVEDMRQNLTDKKKEVKTTPTEIGVRSSRPIERKVSRMQAEGQG